jgi:hypothetical protein
MGVANRDCMHIGVANKCISLVVEVKDCTHMGVTTLYSVGS